MKKRVVFYIEDERPQPLEGPPSFINLEVLEEGEDFVPEDHQHEIVTVGLDSIVETNDDSKKVLSDIIESMLSKYPYIFSNLFFNLFSAGVLAGKENCGGVNEVLFKENWEKSIKLP